MKNLQNLLFRMGEKSHGWTVLDKLDLLKKMEQWPQDKVYAFKLDLLKKLVHHAYANVPFYRSLWDKSGVKPSSDITIFLGRSEPDPQKKKIIFIGKCTQENQRQGLWCRGCPPSKEELYEFLKNSIIE